MWFKVACCVGIMNEEALGMNLSMNVGGIFVTLN